MDTSFSVQNANSATQIADYAKTLRQIALAAPTDFLLN